MLCKRSYGTLITLLKGDEEHKKVLFWSIRCCIALGVLLQGYVNEANSAPLTFCLKHISGYKNDKN